MNQRQEHLKLHSAISQRLNCIPKESEKLRGKFLSWKNEIMILHNNISHFTTLEYELNEHTHTHSPRVKFRKFRTRAKFGELFTQSHTKSLHEHLVEKCLVIDFVLIAKEHETRVFKNQRNRKNGKIGYKFGWARCNLHVWSDRRSMKNWWSFVGSELTIAQSQHKAESDTHNGCITHKAHTQ